jgi:hypothetical protein
MGVLKRFGEVGDIGQDGIGDWERLVEILCKLAIDMVSTRNTLFLEGSLAIDSELITFLPTCLEEISCGREVVIGPGME